MQYQHRWLRGWRGLTLGLVAGLLTAALVGAVAEKASARMECPADMKGCITPSQRAENFREGDYSKVRASRDLDYPRIARVKYFRAVRRWNHHHGGKNHGTFYSWRQLHRADTCTSEGYPTNTWTCSYRHFPDEPRKWREGRVKVLQCGAAMTPALFTGGATFWIGWGAGVCLWMEMD